MIGYKKKEVWMRRSDKFLVEVVHWNTFSDEEEMERFNKYMREIGINKDGTGEKWNVYCYIYKNHPLFGKLTKEDYEYDYPFNLFHGGCTYCNWVYDSVGNALLKKYGSDYTHAYDERFGFYKTEEEAHEVFEDANKLYHALLVMTEENLEGMN